jgi:RimJ/RimL family protein N-acetyltransferase
MMHQLLEDLLEDGFQRVFAESHKYNVPSVRTFLRVGFRLVSAIIVLTLPRERQFVRWCSSDDLESHLRELGIRLDAVPQ